jgi:hypothetical protein
MFDRFFRAVTFAVGFSALAVPAFAATMTFTGLSLDPLARTFSEDGILASGNGFLGIENGSGGLHLDDAGTSAPSKVSFTMATNFNAVSFLLDPVGFDFLVCSGRSSCSEPTYLNVLVQGFSGSTLVSDLTFDMGSSLDPYLVSLGSAFSNISSLLIGVIYPDVASFRAMPGVTSAGPCAPCSHFNIDNVTLAPVPLPAGLPLAVTGLGLLAFVARRRRVA